MNLTCQSIKGERLLIYLGGLFLIGGIITSAWKLTTPYSYWWDELYSVTASSQDIGTLYKFLLADVHPPLYQIVLKAWISCFGDGEVATRSLSWIFCMAALVTLFKSTSKFGALYKYTTVAFFTCNTLFTYYANETRSYAMLLFLATVVITSVQDEKYIFTWKVILASILLSLTHYFGLILVSIIFLIGFLKNCKKPRELIKISLAGISCLIWPAIHVLNGSLLDKTNKNFWIEINGVTDSFSIAANKLIPATGIYPPFILLLLICSALVLSIYCLKKKSKPHIYKLAINTVLSCTMLILFILSVAIVDTHSPISTPRNYIVLLPSVSMVFGAIITFSVCFCPRFANLIAILFILVCSVSLYRSVNSLIKKTEPLENWKEMSEYMTEKFNGESLYFLSPKPVNQTFVYWHFLMCNFYLQKKGLVAIQYDFDDKKLNSPAYVIFGHINSGISAAFETNMSNKKLQPIYQPKDSNGQSGIFYIQ